MVAGYLSMLEDVSNDAREGDRPLGAEDLVALIVALHKSVNDVDSLATLLVGNYENPFVAFQTYASTYLHNRYDVLLKDGDVLGAASLAKTHNLAVPPINVDVVLSDSQKPYDGLFSGKSLGPAPF